MSKILVFGTDRLASLAHYYLRHDSPHEVVGFVNAARSRAWKPVKPGEFEGLPLVPLGELQRVHPPESVLCFAPSGPESRSRGRESGYEVLKSRGYAFVSYTSSSAAISPETDLGENCMIQEQCTIQPFVQIGNNVTLCAGSHVGHHSVIGDHVHIGPHAVLGPGCLIDRECILGPNATITGCLRTARGTSVAAGGVIRGNTAVASFYAGAPTRKRQV